MLPTIASLIDEGMRDAREHYATLLEARPRPHGLDDATIARTKRVNREGLDWCGVYDRQLVRWQEQRLSGAQRREIARLEAVQRDLRWCSRRSLSSPTSSGAARSSAGSPGATSRLAWSTCWALGRIRAGLNAKPGRAATRGGRHWLARVSRAARRLELPVGAGGVGAVGEGRSLDCCPQGQSRQARASRSGSATAF
jgi:hypothetical protein